jgi:hypothetical protein
MHTYTHSVLLQVHIWIRTQCTTCACTHTHTVCFFKYTFEYVHSVLRVHAHTQCASLSTHLNTYTVYYVCMHTHTQCASLSTHLNTYTVYYVCMHTHTHTGCTYRHGPWWDALLLCGRGSQLFWFIGTERGSHCVLCVLIKDTEDKAKAI